ncbi:hypothetical protein PNB18_001573 [Salmonella enterica]|nr:hypothetical protein [Salmonella enterica]EAX9804237.1 hypothetical protein [Salmonella enterica]EBD3754386.1 hypothetical protein [Salmonella enterica]EBD6706998.1 hypothetical protein [Salmonella enterica]EBQ7832911.1 hypothetical protein [Salmonella enterica]
MSKNFWPISLIPSLPFPAVTLSEFCLFAPAILHTITPRRHKKTGHCDRFVTVSVSVWDEIVAQRISERPRHSMQDWLQP